MHRNWVAVAIRADTLKASSVIFPVLNKGNKPLLMTVWALLASRARVAWIPASSFTTVVLGKVLNEAPSSATIPQSTGTWAVLSLWRETNSSGVLTYYPSWTTYLATVFKMTSVLGSMPQRQLILALLSPLVQLASAKRFVDRLKDSSIVGLRLYCVA